MTPNDTMQGLTTTSVGHCQVDPARLCMWALLTLPRSYATLDMQQYGRESTKEADEGF